MSGGETGAMQQKAPVEQRASQPTPAFNSMQGNLMNQFVARLMPQAVQQAMQQATPQERLMQQVMPQIAPQMAPRVMPQVMPMQNRYQQAFQQMLPGLLNPQPYPTMAAPYNPRGSSGGLMGPQPTPASTPLNLSGVSNTNGLSNSQITNYLNNLQPWQMPGYTGE